MVELEKENERLAKKLKKNQESSTKVCCVLYLYLLILYYKKQQSNVCILLFVSNLFGKKYVSNFFLTPNSFNFS